MIKSLSALVLLGATLLSTPLYAHEGWIQDFDEAVALAKKEKKDLLVDFTGSDWCGWCIKLNEEVFDHDTFTEGISKNYVLVALDYPRGEDAKAKVPNPERNAELKDKYQIRGFPTILLMNSDGIVYGQTGYQAGGPEAYLKHVAELRATGRKDLEAVTSAIESFNSTAGPAKLESLGKLIDTLDGLPENSPFASILFEPIEKALALDPENKAGIKLRAVRSLSKRGIHNPELLAAAKELDSTNAAGVYELAVKAFFGKVDGLDTAKTALVMLDALNGQTFKDKEVGFLLNFTAAAWASGPIGDPAASKAYALRAKGIGHEDTDMLSALEEFLKDDAN